MAKLAWPQRALLLMLVLLASRERHGADMLRLAVPFCAGVVGDDPLASLTGV